MTRLQLYLTGPQLDDLEDGREVRVTYNEGKVMIIVPHGQPVVPRVLESQIGLHHGDVARLRRHCALESLDAVLYPPTYGAPDPMDPTRL